MNIAKRFNIATAMEEIKENNSGEFNDILEDQSNEIAEIQDSIEFSTDEIGKGLETIPALLNLSAKIDKNQINGISTECYSDIAQVAFDSIKRTIGLENDKTTVDKIKDFIKKLIESIKNIFSNAINKFKEIFNLFKKNIELKVDNTIKNLPNISKTAPSVNKTITISKEDVNLHRLAYIHNTKHLTFSEVFPKIESVFHTYVENMKILNNGIIEAIKSVLENGDKLFDNDNASSLFVNKEIANIFDKISGNKELADRETFNLNANEEMTYKRSGPVNIINTQPIGENSGEFYSSLIVNSVNEFVNYDDNIKVDILTKDQISNEVEKYLSKFPDLADSVLYLINIYLVKAKSYLNVIEKKYNETTDEVTKNDIEIFYRNIRILFGIILRIQGRQANLMYNYFSYLKNYIELSTTFNMAGDVLKKY